MQEGIDLRHAEILKVTSVASGDGQAVYLGYRCDHRIFQQIEGFTAHEFSGLACGCRVQRQNDRDFDQLIEPGFNFCSLDRILGANNLNPDLCLINAD